MAQTKVFRGTARSIRRLDDGAIAYRYHATDVVIARTDGSIALNSGGYMTATTKLAMNQALNELGRPEQVSQKDFQWFVDGAPFFDGFTINAKGDRP